METKTNGLDAFFERVFVTKAPYQLSESVREWIVRYSPWISLVLVIILLPVIIGGLGLGAVLGGLSMIGGVKTGFLFWLGFVLGVVQLVLLLVALPGLFKRKLSAWRLIYYSALISIVVSVITNIGYMAVGSLIWALVWDAVELYFLFQIKAKYPKEQWKGIHKMNKKVLIIVIVAVAIVAAVILYFLVGPGTKTISNIIGKSKIGNQCKYNDKDLCLFINGWEGVNSSGMTMVSTSTTTDGKVTITTYKTINGISTQVTSSLNGKESMNYIVTGRSSYTLDYTDNTWYQQTITPDNANSTSPETSINDELSYRTKANSTTDPTTYTKIGTEACGKLTCFKYQVITPGVTGKQYIYFDNKDYKLRQMRDEAADGTTTATTFDYSTVTITAPTPTKTTPPVYNSALYVSP